LANNSRLNDESIIMFASIFPNLQLLDLKSCKNISKGIGQVLKSCCKIRNLNLGYCSTVKLLEMNFRVPRLEVLNFSYTKVNDEILYVTSKNCRGLLHLLLKNSYDVTVTEK
jgi:F-box and leucine-rich repeat protein 2/20